MDQRVIIMRGIPGSGKTTHAQSLLDLYRRIPREIVSADHFFIDDEGVYKFDPSSIKDAHSACFNNFLFFLGIGRNIIVDNTNTRIWEFERYIEKAKEHDAMIRIVRMDTPLDVCLSRQTHGVPEDKVRQMYERFEDYPGEIIIR